MRGLWWSSDDSNLVTAGADGAVYEWRVLEGRRARELVQKGWTYTAVVSAGTGWGGIASGLCLMLWTSAAVAAACWASGRHTLLSSTPLPFTAPFPSLSASQPPQAGTHAAGSNPANPAAVAGGASSVFTAALDKKIRTLEEPAAGGGLAVAAEVDTGAVLTQIVAPGPGVAG